MEKDVLAFLEQQSFEFIDDAISFFGTVKDYSVEIDFNSRCSTLNIEVFKEEEEEPLVLRGGFIDDVFALLESRLQEHYAEIKAMQDQMNHEEYLWNHR